MILSDASSLHWIAVGVLLLLLLVIAALLRSRRRLPYQACEQLYSAAELRFLHSLEKALGERGRVYAKVRLADVIRVRSGLRGRYFFQAFNAIACKHVDYVICDPLSHRILCVVELDDRSHDRPERRARDAFVDRALAAAGVPILHVPVRRRYVIRDLREELLPLLEPA